MGKGGLYGNVLRIKPPMCIHKEDVDFMVECKCLSAKSRLVFFIFPFNDSKLFT